MFRVRNKKQTYYCYSEEEKRNAIEKLKGKPEITRFKGLGEMNPSQLRETVMDPSSRQLVCLSISSSDNANSVMDLLLSKKRAPDRKDWLEKKGSLAEIN